MLYIFKKNLNYFFIWGLLFEVVWGRADPGAWATCSIRIPSQSHHFSIKNYQTISLKNFQPPNLRNCLKNFFFPLNCISCNNKLKSTPSSHCPPRPWHNNYVKDFEALTRGFGFRRYCTYTMDNNWQKTLYLSFFQCTTELMETRWLK